MEKFFKYTSALNMWNLVFSSFMATLSFLMGDIAVGFIFIAFYLTSVIGYFAIKFDKLSHLNLPNFLLILATLSAVAYFYFPEVLTAIASIVGVASFIYLLVEKVISDAYR